MSRVYSILLVLILQLGCTSVPTITDIQQQKFRDLLNLAMQGDVSAQTSVGLRYSRGRGVEKDYIKSVYWTRKAHQGGSVWATNNLGLNYLNGEGVEENYEKAYELFLSAAFRGNWSSIQSLAFMYNNGLWVDKDLKKAFDLYFFVARCSDSNTTSAKVVVGSHYLMGRGTVKSIVNAEYWYKRAVDHSKNKSAKLGLTAITWFKSRLKNHLDSTPDSQKIYVPYYESVTFGELKSITDDELIAIACIILSDDEIQGVLSSILDK